MATNHVESEKNYQARIRAARTLGVDSFWLGLILKDDSGKTRGQYSLSESRETAKIAREVYRRHESEIDAMFMQYEVILGKIKNGKEVAGELRRGKECRVCKKSNMGSHDACPVCLDVYLHEFRNDFLRQVNSCDALRIIDAKGGK